VKIIGNQQALQETSSTEFTGQLTWWPVRL